MFKKRNKGLGGVGNHRKVKLNEFYTLSEDEYNEFNMDYISYELLDDYGNKRKFYGRVCAVIVAFSLVCSFFLDKNYALAFQMFSFFCVLAYIPYDLGLIDNINKIEGNIFHPKGYVKDLIEIIVTHKVGIAGFSVYESEVDEYNGHIVTVTYYDVNGDEEPLALSFGLDIGEFDVESIELTKMYRICVDGLKTCLENGLVGKNIEQIQAEENSKML